jgi:transcriptional regulator with XRE-family HTH domain
VGTTSSGLGIGVFEDPRFYEALGRAIKVVRAQRGLSRGRLAELAEISYPYLSEIENGKKRPSSKALLTIADALSVPTSELLALAEQIATQLLSDDAAEAEPSLPGPRVGSSIPLPESAPSRAPVDSLTARILSVRAPDSSLQRAAKTIEGLQSQAAEATPSRPVPDGRDVDRRQRARVRLAAAAHRLAIEDLERLADLAERLSR